MSELDINPEEIGEKLKKNKLLIPAIIIGVLAGLYFLSRSGGAGTPLDFGGGDEIVPPESDESVEGSNGEAVDSSAISDLQDSIDALQENQAGVSGSLTDALNNALDWVTEALRQQQQDTQSAIDSIQSNDSPYDISSDLLGQLLDNLPDVPNILPPEASGFYDDGYTSDGATFNYSDRVQEQIREAQQQVTTKVLRPTAINTVITPKSVLPTNLPQTVRNSIVKTTERVTNVGKTILPRTRGSITPTFNSSRIQSLGGFGGSKGISQKARQIVPKFNSPNIRSSGGFGSAVKRLVPTVNSTKIQSKGGFGGSR